jgi:flagellar basal-body rod protein FlgG
MAGIRRHLVERGLFIAASGMLAAQIRQDVIANNLANATNPGFKGEVLSQIAFGDLLLSNTLTGDSIGPLSAGTLVTDIKPNLTNQGFRWTQNTLDLAIGGNGWFSVQTPQGVRYTRNGAFTTDAQGFITTAQGDRVLGKNGQPINVSGGGRLSIARNGDVHVGNRLVGTVGVTALQPSSLHKEGDNYLTGTVDPNAKLGSVAQGALETSNVNTVKEMVALIENMREFEADQKMIRAVDDTLGGAVNQVGRV